MLSNTVQSTQEIATYNMNIIVTDAQMVTPVLVYSTLKRIYNLPVAQLLGAGTLNQAGTFRKYILRII